MLVSKINNEYLIWVDYSSRWATTFEITKEEFARIQSGLAEIVDDEVVNLPSLEPIDPVDNGLCEVLIPISIKDEQEIKSKTDEIIKLFTGNITWDVVEINEIKYRKLYNIHIDNVSSFLSSKEYIQFSQAGVLFDKKIQDLFV